MKRELGIGCCGLACCLCAKEGCSGCKKDGCPDAAWRKSLKCSREKGYDGCWVCEHFPCADNPMLAKLKPRAFAAFVRQYGIEKLMDCLARNEALGVVYHEPDTIIGDYDRCQDEAAIFELLLNGPQ